MLLSRLFPPLRSHSVLHMCCRHRWRRARLRPVVAHASRCCLSCRCETAKWPSRSKEQIFYGKEASPLAIKGNHVPYHMKKQCVL
jgi:hypothetical protein